MRRILLARITLTVIGVAVWGYGNATDQPAYMYAGMVVLAISLVMRFLPKRWFDDRTE
jgi:hypothetical protein